MGASSEALFLCSSGGDGLDLLKGKKIMVWTFMGNTRMYNALRDYGDRISQIGLFSFKVRAALLVMLQVHLPHFFQIWKV